MQVVVEVFHSFREPLLGVTGKIEFERKEDRTPVTKWDIAVEKALKERLVQHDETVGFSGEETGQSGSVDRYWVVDPIDGTAGFIRGMDHATNMAAYIENGEVVASVIYDFYRNITYTAIRGEGAYRNGERMQVNNNRRDGNQVIYSFTRRSFASIQEALGVLKMRAVLPLGHAGHSYVLLAEGKIDGIVNLNPETAVHDNAPGMLLCEEAGAEVLPLDEGTGVERRRFIVGSPFVVDTIERSGLF